MKFKEVVVVVVWQSYFLPLLTSLNIDSTLF